MTPKTKRRSLVTGWYKILCGYSRTGYAWARDPERGACTCIPCTPPRVQTAPVTESAGA